MKRFESTDRHGRFTDVNQNTTFVDKVDDDAASPKIAGSNLKLNVCSSPPPRNGLSSPGVNRHYSPSDFKMEIGGLSPRPNELITRSPSPRLNEINAIINGSHVSPRLDDTYKHTEKDMNGSKFVFHFVICF